MITVKGKEYPWRKGMTVADLLKEVGFKFGRWLDVVYLQLML